MSNKVDVLAVMELAYRHLNGGTDSLSTAEFVAAHAGMKEVRAAVAELIEAVERLFGADMEYCMEMDGKEDQLEAARFAKSALSRVKGE